MTLRAVEFYSGIGAFAQAARKHDIEILAAFDQSQWANITYHKNHGHLPHSRNLDSIPLKEVPEADLWWMSPPCTPFSRRGHQKDLRDNRARSFLHLIGMIEKKRPKHILIENVEGFDGSMVQEILFDQLKKCGYGFSQLALCPTTFGVPMLRPRIFIIASADASMEAPRLPVAAKRQFLREYLRTMGGEGDNESKTSDPEAGLSTGADANARFICNTAMLERYAPVLNIVDPKKTDSYLICFTSGYYRCRTASGSLIKTAEGKVRFVSPQEILGLLGFDPAFAIPDTISLEVAYRLVCNSVDVRAISFLLKEVLHCP